MKSEHTANLALGQAKPLPSNGWKVGANFAKPLPVRKPVSLLAKILKAIK